MNSTQKFVSELPRKSYIHRLFTMKIIYNSRNKTWKVTKKECLFFENSIIVTLNAIWLQFQKTFSKFFTLFPNHSAHSAIFSIDFPEFFFWLIFSKLWFCLQISYKNWLEGPWSLCPYQTTKLSMRWTRMRQSLPLRKRFGGSQTKAFWRIAIYLLILRKSIHFGAFFSATRKGCPSTNWSKFYRSNDHYLENVQWIHGCLNVFY